MKGYPGAAEETLEQISLEHFFRGCLDKQSAGIAMSKNPKTVSKAIRYVKEAANNQKLLFRNKFSHSVKKVSFAPGAQSESSNEEVTNLKVRQAQIPSANSYTALSSKTKEAVTVKQVSDLVEKVETLETLYRKIARSNTGTRDKSPTPPPANCFRCQEMGHFARECPQAKSNPKCVPMTASIPAAV